MFHQLSGLVLPDKLKKAKQSGEEVLLQETSLKNVPFVPHEQLNSLTWNGWVNDSPALLIVSMCTDQSFIAYEDA